MWLDTEESKEVADKITICSVCKIEFLAIRATRKYCGSACANAASRSFYKTNPAIKERKRAFLRSDRGRAYAKAWYQENKVHYLQRQKLSSTARRRLYRLKIFDLLGGAQCRKCGFDDYRALQIDHVNGGGGKQLKSDTRLLKPAYYFTIIVQKPSDYQVLCANCNWIKRDENHELRKQ
jgi:hypothetical protein